MWVETFNLESNKLTGSIPDAFEEFPAISWIEASNNKLSGSIPRPGSSSSSSSSSSSVSENDFRMTFIRECTPKDFFYPLQAAATIF